MEDELESTQQVSPISTIKSNIRPQALAKIAAVMLGYHQERLSLPQAEIFPGDPQIAAGAESVLLRRIASAREMQVEQVSSLTYRVESAQHQEALNIERVRQNLHQIENSLPEEQPVAETHNQETIVDTSLADQGFVRTLFKYGFSQTLNSVSRYFKAKDLMIHYYNWKFYDNHGFWRTLQAGRWFNAIYTLFEKTIVMPVLETDIRSVEGKVTIAREETIEPESWREFIDEAPEYLFFMQREYDRFVRRGRIEKLNSSKIRFPKYEIATTLAVTSFVDEGLSSLLSIDKMIHFTSPAAVPFAIGLSVICVPIVMGYGIVPLYNHLKRDFAKLLSSLPRQENRRSLQATSSLRV